MRLCQFRCECGGCSEAAEYLYCHRVLLTSSHACGGHAHVRTHHMACDCASAIYMYLCIDMQCTCVLCHYSALCIGPTASCPSGGRAPGLRLGALLCCVQGCVLVYAHCTTPPAPPSCPPPSLSCLPACAHVPLSSLPLLYLYLFICVVSQLGCFRE